MEKELHGEPATPEEIWAILRAVSKTLIQDTHKIRQVEARPGSFCKVNLWVSWNYCPGITGGQVL